MWSSRAAKEIHTRKTDKDDKQRDCVVYGWKRWCVYLG